MKRLNKKKTLGLLLLFVLIQCCVLAQQEPRNSEYQEPVTIMWLNTYGNIRISNRLFWVAQTHFRMAEKGNTPFVGQVAQIYNRHAISYLFSKKFNVSLGGVLRVNYNTDEGPEERNTVPEWRIWHEYMFAMPLTRMMVYHRIRIEHRWSQGFAEDSEYIFRNRWRYMLKFKIPLNKPKLATNTFYVSPEAELIMQSGKPVVGSPFEDLRLHTSFGYILNPRITVAAGIMYSHGQNLIDSSIYRQNWTMRFHLYFSPDLRKIKRKLPSIHQGD